MAQEKSVTDSFVAILLNPTCENGRKMIIFVSVFLLSIVFLMCLNCYQVGCTALTFFMAITIMILTTYILYVAIKMPVPVKCAASSSRKA